MVDNKHMGLLSSLLSVKPGQTQGAPKPPPIMSTLDNLYTGYLKTLGGVHGWSTFSPNVQTPAFEPRDNTYLPGQQAPWAVDSPQPVQINPHALIQTAPAFAPSNYKPAVNRLLI